jgi:hypothetical protein
MSFLVFIVGCVSEKTDGNQITYTYAFWVPLAYIFGGIALAVVGWSIRKKEKQIGSGMLFLGPLLALLGFNEPLFDKLTINDEGMNVRVGGIRATEEQVKFDDVDSAYYADGEARGMGGKKTTTPYLICTQKGGLPTRIHLNNSIMKQAMPKILAKLRAHNISIADPPQ